MSNMFLSSAPDLHVLSAKAAAAAAALMHASTCTKVD